MRTCLGMARGCPVRRTLSSHIKDRRRGLPPFLAASVVEQLVVVLLEEFANDILEVLGPGALGLRFGGKAGAFGCLRLLATLVAFARSPTLAAALA